MPLNTTQEELEIIRTALRAYRDSLRDRAGVYCTGYLATGINLCVQRMNVETVMDKLEQLPSSSCQVPLPIPVLVPNRSTKTPANVPVLRAA